MARCCQRTSGVAAEQPHLVAHRRRAVIIRGRTLAAHGVAAEFIGQAREEVAQPSPVVFVELVGHVEREHPVAGGAAQRLVAGGGQVLARGEGHELPPELIDDLSDAARGVGRSDDDLLDEVRDAAEAGGQVTCLVGEGQAQRDAGGTRGCGPRGRGDVRGQEGTCVSRPPVSSLLACGLQSRYPGHRPRQAG